MLRMGHTFHDPAAVGVLKSLRDDGLMGSVFGTGAELSVRHVKRVERDVAIVYVGDYYEGFSGVYGANEHNLVCYDVVNPRFAEWARKGADVLVSAIDAYRRQATLPSDARDRCGAFNY